MHRTDFAPVLSATSNRVSVWIISIFPTCTRRPPAPETLSDTANQPVSLGPVVHTANHLQGFPGQNFALFIAKPAIVAKHHNRVKHFSATCSNRQAQILLRQLQEGG